MEQLFEIIGNYGFFVTDVNKPGNYIQDNDLIIGALHDDETGECLQLTTLPFSKLRPAQRLPEWFLKMGEVVKTTFTSTQNEDQTYIIYFDGGVKVIEQNGNESSATAVYIHSEDMDQINALLKK